MVEHQKPDFCQTSAANWWLGRVLPPRLSFCFVGYALTGLISVSASGNGVNGSHPAADHTFDLPVVTSSDSATASKSPEEKPIELTEDQYLWLQSIRKHAGVDTRSLTELNLDQKGHEKLLRDFAKRALRAKLQVDALTEEVVEAKQKQRRALQAMATGVEAMSEREYRDLVSARQQCERDCRQAMASIGQQSRQFAGIEVLAESQRSPQENLAALRQKLAKRQSPVERQEKARGKRLQLAKIKKAEASVWSLPEQVIQAEFDLEQLDVEFSRENLAQ